jgi:uncharacterized protein (DUF433 family)
MSGITCFGGTRVPVQSLIDFLEGGETLLTLDRGLELQQNLARFQIGIVIVHVALRAVRGRE